ncbi:transposase [Candidatus Pacearchaeota archaeon CG_4_9_14_0_2_um_filter_39_13]|nr:transposase [Candidatus Pacearchaeota archaeon]OIO42166.1 MAG: transposase [Candidatus Pacearchaeota archaeon CG1_02_39_14]PJC44532.1 MAG: transposase [Candidatus Pacearchaeota archaeon CG_4_9_14_0_2_um_filter_39_13]
MDDSRTYHKVVRRLREFFEGKGFVEVPAQARRSILAACEDPKTISTYNFSGKIWPLPQTGQMWLEYELLKNPGFNGVFCVTTSYRDEPNPIQGRHDLIFPMFEFESKGSMFNLKELEVELLRFLGFKDFQEADYEEICKKYGVESIEAEEEAKLCKDYGSAVLLQKFPERTSPFWNMKHLGGGIYGKVDVILHGMETIGSAERSCDAEEMRNSFETISDGGYSSLLFEKFGQERVLKELESYFSLKMFPRFGGGIGVTRMARAMKMEGLL